MDEAAGDALALRRPALGERFRRISGDLDVGTVVIRVSTGIGGILEHSRTEHLVRFYSFRTLGFSSRSRSASCVQVILSSRFSLPDEMVRSLRNEIVEQPLLQHQSKTLLLLAACRLPPQADWFNDDFSLFLRIIPLLFVVQ